MLSVILLLKPWPALMGMLREGCAAQRLRPGLRDQASEGNDGQVCGWDGPVLPTRSALGTCGDRRRVNWAGMPQARGHDSAGEELLLYMGVE